MENWKEISDYIDSKQVKYDVYFTKSQNDAIVNVPRLIHEGYRNFVVVGGDGTTNEVINGIFSQTEVPYSEICMGSISMGTGNDWNKYYKWGTDAKKSIDRILEHHITTQDVGVVKFDNDGEPKTKYFINSIGFGFDAQIVKMTNALTHEQRGKEIAYLLSLLKCLMKCKKINFTVEYDGNIISDRILSINIGNCRYSGGGMQQTPNAIANDGLFDISVFGNISKFFVIKNVSRLYNGTITHINTPNVSFRRAKQIKISAPIPTIAEIDGEIIGNGPYELSIIHNGLNVID